MIRACVPLTDGVEELEAVSIVDVCRRAGWQVVAAGLRGPEPVAGSRGVRLLPDLPWDAVALDQFEVLALPGGWAGVRTLAADARVLSAVRQAAAAGRWVGAICAAPLVLQAAGVLAGRRATCHPSVRAQLTAARLCDEPVVVDGNLVTSRGPGTAIEFALTLIRLASGPAAEEAVRRGLAF